MLRNIRLHMYYNTEKYIWKIKINLILFLKNEKEILSWCMLTIFANHR